MTLPVGTLLDPRSDDEPKPGHIVCTPTGGVAVRLTDGAWLFAGAVYDYTWGDLVHPGDVVVVVGHVSRAAKP